MVNEKMNYKMKKVLTIIAALFFAMQMFSFSEIKNANIQYVNLDNGKILEKKILGNGNILFVYEHKEDVRYIELYKAYGKIWNLYDTPSKDNLIYTAKKNDIFHIKEIVVERSSLDKKSDKVFYKVNFGNITGWLCDFTDDIYWNDSAKIQIAQTLKTDECEWHLVNVSKKFEFQDSTELRENPGYKSKIIGTMKFDKKYSFDERFLFVDLITIEKQFFRNWIRVNYKGSIGWTTSDNCFGTRLPITEITATTFMIPEDEI